MTDKNTVFTVEGAKTFADTYCISCDAKKDSRGCTGETAENCRSFQKKRNIRHEIALTKARLDDLFEMLDKEFSYDAGAEG